MRYFLYIQYDGTAYHGWQNQPNAVTVQSVIEEKLSLILRTATAIVGAGRTDTGVHARMMVAHADFDTADPAALTIRLNQVLPPDIAVTRIVAVRPDAHARFSATARTYRYYIATRKDPFDHAHSWRVYWPLDVAKMNEAAGVLQGFTDFSSFAKSHTDVKTHNCRIVTARWEATDDGLLVFSIQADRFLRNMVRAIVGTLVEVGRGRISVAAFRDTIERRDRCAAGDSAPAHGLFLEDIAYPADLFIGNA